MNRKKVTKRRAFSVGSRRADHKRRAGRASFWPATEKRPSQASLAAVELFARTSQIFAARVSLVALAARRALTVERASLEALVVRWALAVAQVLLVALVAALAWPAVLYQNWVAASAAGLVLGLDLAWCPDWALELDLALYRDSALYPGSAAVLGAGWALAMDLAWYPDSVWRPDSVLD